MGQKTIQPTRLSGRVKVPPSKSMAHRAIICAALAEGRSTVENIAFSDDILATIEGMRRLGARIEDIGGALVVDGIGQGQAICGLPEIDCKESGSTLRFLIPVALGLARGARFTGQGNLGKRPLDVYTKIFDEQGIAYQAQGPLLDFQVSGQLRAGTFSMQGDVSSQFITGLLFILPLMEEDSELIITTHMESKSYVDMTLSVLADFGIRVENEAYRRFIIPGGQKYRATRYRVEGDFSQAAFFLCADAMGSAVQVEDLKRDSLQGDSAVLDILQRMGAEVCQEDGTVCCRADALHAVDIDASQCPDIIPVVSAAAALCKGKTTIRNAGRLRIKECDRLHAIFAELTKLGARIKEREDSLEIEGVERFAGGTVWSHKDHRIAMMLAIAATRAEGPVVIEDWECVSKSYPNFFEDYSMLGGNCQ
ncbi:MAG: 3-phosphoshikimate 1-carboxyvinyltransferase [Clostridiales bacterium]|nr:3-phosphoshikimate 1-carboxyvinyltransferase [Clostridiales bacterium]